MFTLLWGWIKKIGQLIALPFSKLGGMKGLRPFLLWTLHFLLVAGILVGLWYLNYLFDLEQAVRAPTPFLGKFWLPLLFVLVYLMGWLAWWISRILATSEGSSLFPDLDHAWREAKNALEQSGIDLTHTPLFLVLGRPAHSALTLFQTARMPLIVSEVPHSSEAPLSVCANAEGIYVCCSGASLLGEQVRMLTQTLGTFASPHPEASQRGSSEWDENEPPHDVSADVADGQQPEPVAVLTEPSEASAEDDADRPAHASPQAHVVLQTAEGQERTIARLKHLCALIRNERQPYCPMNGVLAVLPAASTDDDTRTQETSVLLRQDLEAVRYAMQLRCPLLAIVADIQQLPGAQTFLDRFPESKRSQRLGVPCPYLGDNEISDEIQRVEQAISWISNDLVPPLVHRLLRASSDEAALEGNRQLHEFMQQIRHREVRLSRILTRGIFADRHWFFSGCFLAATGGNAVRDQAFLAEVLPQLVQTQNFVYWTPDALQEDASCRRWAIFGVVIVVLFVIAMTAAMVWLY